MRGLDLLLRLLGLAACWVIVSEGRLEYWYYGLLAVPLATAVSIVIQPLRPLRLPGPRRAWRAIVLIVWAVGRMVTGAIDVARRALGPSRLVDPQHVELPAHLPIGRGGLLAATFANLMPGTLVYALGDTTIGMHVLAPDLDAVDGWAGLARRIDDAVGDERHEHPEAATNPAADDDTAERDDA